MILHGEGESILSALLLPDPSYHLHYLPHDFLSVLSSFWFFRPSILTSFFSSHRFFPFHPTFLPRFVTIMSWLSMSQILFITFSHVLRATRSLRTSAFDFRPLFHVPFVLLSCHVLSCFVLSCMFNFILY